MTTLTDKKTCTYHERNVACRSAAVWEYPESWAHPSWPLCERHIKPEFWPPDLRKKLPGLLRRLVLPQPEATS